MQPEGKTIEVKSVREATQETANPTQGANRMVYALVAYHYPQYKLEDVEKMPYRDVDLLLSTVRRIEAERLYNLTMIASAPHSDKGKGVKNLLEHFKKALNI